MRDQVCRTRMGALIVRTGLLLSYTGGRGISETCDLSLSLSAGVTCCLLGFTSLDGFLWAVVCLGFMGSGLCVGYLRVKGLGL